jgi:hypothetical protein
MNTLPVLALLLAGMHGWQNAAPADAPSAPSPKEVARKAPGVASFTLDWPGAEVPHWSIEVGEEAGDKSSGRYDELGDGSPASARTTQPITVSTATSERLRAPYKTVAGGNCESKAKHIAQTGAKRLAYTMDGSDVWSSCTFNFSDDAAVMDAVAAFEAIAETMQYGARLQHEHRFDRLGLDAEIDALIAENKEGRAIELQNITTVLQSIADDDRVIERVRRKAAHLLQDAAPAPSPSPLSNPL